MVFAALVCWRGTLWSLLFIDKLLSQTGDLETSLSQGLPTGTICFPTWAGKSQPWLSQEHLWSAVRQSEPPFSGCSAKTPPKDSSWCDHHMCNASAELLSDKALLKATVAAVFPKWDQLTWQPLPSRISAYSFFFPPSLLSATNSYVVGIWLSESLCKWMQLIYSEKPNFLFLGYQKIAGDWIDRQQKTMRGDWGG